MRSIVAPLWQELSSLWSGVEFPLYDQSSEAADQELTGVTAAAPAQAMTNTGLPTGRFEHCW